MRSTVTNAWGHEEALCPVRFRVNAGEGRISKTHCLGQRSLPPDRVNLGGLHRCFIGEHAGHALQQCREPSPRWRDTPTCCGDRRARDHVEDRSRQQRTNGESKAKHRKNTSTDRLRFDRLNYRDLTWKKVMHRILRLTTPFFISSHLSFAKIKRSAKRHHRSLVKHMLRSADGKCPASWKRKMSGFTSIACVLCV